MDKPKCCDLYQYYNIPHSFRIANHEYQVLLKEFVILDNHYVYGAFSSTYQTIEVATKIKTDDGPVNLSDECVRNSFWHEVMHCFNYYWNTDCDEGLAQTFANFMREFEITRK